ncbi:MAG: VOC family protein [Candidatus Heimdallarchaeota archaeon]|nr:VOC family protein [Candidatus Heimdallarchaeota archaeon]MCK5158500.1 VOC family protein [Candidatus Heimdallarchaeota archaeon]MCK5183242.1 VOC family protein [Candidatus Heimdallarchaeota archaeon]MCK5297369.1 VOC family protein [Candidatus Heimdallarchaeota archaeon]
MTMNFVSQISFLYYRDLVKAVKFYEEIFDFELVVDQNWAKIYKVTDGAHIGLVDEKRGTFNWQKEKTVMITLVTSKADEVDAWYENLKQYNVKFLSEPKDHKEINIRCFIFEDPEGYVIEIQHFYD